MDRMQDETAKMINGEQGVGMMDGCLRAAEYRKRAHGMGAFYVVQWTEGTRANIVYLLTWC